MQKLFNKILVPVDFSPRSKAAVEKAVEIAQQYNCQIHLLHVANHSPFTTIALAEGHTMVPAIMVENKVELEAQMKRLIKYIELLATDTVQVFCGIREGSWNESVVEYVYDNHIDLVLIGQNRSALTKRKMFVNPDFIAEKTNIPVITIPSNRRLTKLYSIVIPVTNFLPVRKLMYGVYIGSFYNTTIKLLGVENERVKKQVQYYLAKSLQLITDNCDVRVETEIIVSENVAEAVHEFAMLQSADLVIVNPGTQTKMPGFFSSLLGNILQKYSAPPILAVNPG
ncbi:universal stress protein [Ferruginibacter paludis]|uniref:universal stress protein n=1 Tax=Ferruginibacter paludis TaxID=1310417 RepID=UPI0025B37B1E|nr:universal stress protein [Ferruginibacter paludis]MDN3656686.1 universal stress protein [Ferruginibacter paludis]